MKAKIKKFFKINKGAELVQIIFSMVISVALLTIATTYVSTTLSEHANMQESSTCKKTANGKSDIYVIIEKIDRNKDGVIDEIYYTISYRDYNNHLWTKPDIVKTKKDADGHHLISFNGKTAKEIEAETGLNETIITEAYLSLANNALKRYGSTGDCD